MVSVHLCVCVFKSVCVLEEGRSKVSVRYRTEEHKNIRKKRKVESSSIVSATTTHSHTHTPPVGPHVTVYSGVNIHQKKKGKTPVW